MLIIQIFLTFPQCFQQPCLFIIIKRRDSVVRPFLKFRQTENLSPPKKLKMIYKCTLTLSQINPDFYVSAVQIF